MSTPALAPPAAGEPWLRRAGRRLGRSLLIAALVALAAIALYLLAATRWHYSSGERAGYVQKFSKKGWVCKTWEGEIAMASLPGTMPELFAFTVRDDTVAAQVNAHLGARVVLSYEQHLGLPSCFGDTQYWVTRARRAEP
jgi:hypothetical protein